MHYVVPVVTNLCIMYYL